MTLEISSLSWARLEVRGGEELRDWRSSRKVKVPGHEFTPQFKMGNWDGYYYPGGKFRRCSPTPSSGGYEKRWSLVISRGLLPDLSELGIPPGYLKRPLSPEEMEWVQSLPGTLRDYQRETIVKALIYRWGRAALATNAGKGAIIALLSELWDSLGKRVLILCDEIAVFNALEGEIEEWADAPIGKVESGVKEIPEGRIVLAMVPTLSRRVKDHEDWREWVRGFDALLLDEADKATAKTWKRILALTDDSEYRIGFSGTFPEDGHEALIIEELMGPVLTQAKNIELVERGISARPKVFLHGFDASRTLRRTDRPDDWWEIPGAGKRRWIYETAIVYNHHRHRFIQDLIRPGIRTCIIVNRVAHGEELEAFLNTQGPQAVFLSGSDSKSHRKKVLDAFEGGKFPILIATKILDRGTNRLGHAVDLIFASGEGSNRQTLQRIGRGLRRSEGKEFLFLRDIVDQGHRYLHSAGKKRINLYAEEGFEVEARNGA